MELLKLCISGRYIFRKCYGGYDRNGQPRENIFLVNPSAGRICLGYEPNELKGQKNRK